MAAEAPKPTRAGGGGAVPHVHAVTNDRIVVRPGFLDRARGVMAALGERGAVHLRAHALATARLYELAAALAPVQSASGCWVVVNDRVDVALAAGAAGVQLTSRSIPVRDARAMAPALALGASVHSVAEAEEAALDGAAWVVAGQVFESGTHPGEPGRGLAFVRSVVEATPLPCVAIGGVRPEHVAALRAMGVHGVAAISGIWGADDAERAAIDYLSQYHAGSIAERSDAPRER